MSDDLVRKLIAEVIGTFVLVFCGTSAALATGNYVFGFGFALIAIVYAIGHISGAHVNPAVTLSLALTGKFPMPDVPYYWGAQIIGAVLASLLVRSIFGNDERNLAANAVNPDFSLLQGFLMEVILTAILVFVIHAVATDKRAPAAAAGLAIGGTLLLLHVVGGEVSGSSVNPARSLAPALVSGTFSDLWIYLTAPFIGGAIGAIGYEFIRGPQGSSATPAETTTTEPHRGDRFERGGGRPPRRERSERQAEPRFDRPERPERPERPDRGERPERPDRGERIERERPAPPRQAQSNPQRRPPPQDPLER